MLYLGICLEALDIRDEPSEQRCPRGPFKGDIFATQLQKAAAAPAQLVHSASCSSPCSHHNSKLKTHTTTTHTRISEPLFYLTNIVCDFLELLLCLCDPATQKLRFVKQMSQQEVTNSTNDVR